VKDFHADNAEREPVRSVPEKRALRRQAAKLTIAQSANRKPADITLDRPAEIGQQKRND
jgi:hypothetical protein